LLVGHPGNWCSSNSGHR